MSTGQLAASLLEKYDGDFLASMVWLSYREISILRIVLLAVGLVVEVTVL